MLTNYLKIALRNLLKQKVYSVINVFGLAVGMACCLLILALVHNEWSYDAFHDDAEAIYRVHIHALTPEGEVEVKAGQPLPLGPTLLAEMPEVEQAARLQYIGAVVKAEGTDAFEEQVLFTDASFFDVFSFRVARGNAAQPLPAPDAVVLTTGMAQKYFGEADPVGQRLRVSLGGAFEEFVVTAVAEEPPTNSSITFGIVLPLERSRSYIQWGDLWTSWVANTYVRLGAAEQAAVLSEKLPAFVAQHYGPMVQTWRILQWLSEEEGAFQLQLQPLGDIHFAPEVQQAQTPATDPRYPLLLAALAFAILLIACINFTTLAVGRAARRAKEVSLRKVLGAVRLQLMKQFWGEALLLSVLALLLGLALTEAFLPFFNDLTGKTLGLAYLRDAPAMLMLLGLALGTALLAGAYPAVYLSRFQPIETLKKSVRAQGKNRWMQSLVVVQFALSIFFIAGVLVVSGQVRYLKNKNLGFDGEQVVVIPTHSTDLAESEQRVNTFKNEAQRHPNVVQVAAASTSFGRGLSWNSFSTDDGAHFVYTNRIDYDFIETLGMEIAAGRRFSEAFPGDAQQGVLVNEALVNDYGWDDPVGQILEGFSLDMEGKTTPTVVGVVKDYHFQSLHNAIEPMVLFLRPRDDAFRYLFARLRGEDLPGTLAALEAAWLRAAPDRPFTYHFLDDDFDRQYRAEEQWEHVVTYAALFALLIACLGLFGLAAFTAERRTKEIGIRKTLGASVPGLAAFLSKDFLKLVLLANVLAWPVAYLLLNQWLARFAYHIDISWGIFLIAGLTALGIALVTVSYQAIKAALADPVKSLRYE